MLCSFWVRRVIILFMQTKIPEISTQINNHETLNVLDKKYSTLGPIWVSHQMEWINGVYSCFKDHDKFLIIIFLTKKTLDFYSNNFIKVTYDQFFSSKTIEIEKFNVAEVSIALRIPKESARRKILELEEKGVIRRVNKKIIIDRSCFNYSKPKDTIKRTSAFLATFSSMCFEEKILEKKLTSAELELIIKNNFSIIWNFYYEMQIPMMNEYKIFFKDLESFHIFGTCVVNQHFHAKKFAESNMGRENFIKNFLTGNRMQGVNAMSIAEITGIPRATVIRKLKKLVKKNFLSIDKKKHYRLMGHFTNTLKPTQKKVFTRLANFSAKIFNLAIFN